MKLKGKILNPNILIFLVFVSAVLSIATVASCAFVLEYHDFLYLYIYLAMIVFLISMAFSYMKGKNELMKISFISFLAGIFFIRTENFVGGITNVSESILSTSMKNGIIVLDILTFAFFIFPFINYYIMNATFTSKISTPKENKLLIGIDIALCIINLIVVIVVKDMYSFTEDRVVAILTFANMIVMLYIFMLVEDVIISPNIQNVTSKQKTKKSK